MNNNYWNIFVIIFFLWFDTPVLLQGMQRVTLFANFCKTQFVLKKMKVN